MASLTDYYFRRYPPCDSGVEPTYQVQNTATATTAANFDWTSTLAANTPKGTVFLAVCAQTNNIAVRFKPTNSAAATTLTNGAFILAGTTVIFHVDPIQHKFIDVISQTGAGTMQVQVTSPIWQRNNQ